ncbi:MAG TPA: hypothetical protein VFD15_01940 [Clostridia bacterium]|nr:hypothetical protein [Clostridia bacterium]
MDLGENCAYQRRPKATKGDPRRPRHPKATKAPKATKGTPRRPKVPWENRAYQRRPKVPKVPKGDPKVTQR